MRKFGVEIELNSFDQRDFKKNPLGRNEQPEGMEYIADIIKSLGLPVKIQGWQHNHNNDEWVCKPDSSCGIEVCSPVSSDLVDILKFVDCLSQDQNIRVDDRCSLHVHIDVKDCVFASNFNKNYDFEKSIDLASILAWWIKCEPVFFDSFPKSRKLNKYCQCIGISDVFKSDDNVSPSLIIKNLGESKYFSANVYHLKKGSRASIEFRLADHFACIDSHFLNNWVNLLIHFIDRAIFVGLPNSFCWLNPKEVFDFLDFNNSGKEEVRNWFLARIITNIKSDISYWNSFRNVAFLEVNEILNELQLDKDLISYLRQMDK
jgi:hypothetical protein